MMPFELRQRGIVISLIACALIQAACGSESQPSSPAEGGRAGTGGSAGTALDAGVDTSAGSGGSGGSAGDSGMDSGAEADGSPGCRGFVMPSDCTIPVNAVLPGELRCTGLYGDWPKRELACGISGFKPAFELWSDGAEKHRYVYLPPGTQVDVTSADAFVFPVGTQFWKEFRVPVDGGFRLGETRLLRKSDLGWIYTSYVWSVDGQTAVQTNDGVADLHGSGHTVPTRDQCKDCHVGRTDFILGWDFLLLGRGATGLTRDELHRRGLLVASGAPAPAPTAEIPGDDVERTALGYLHANCGVSCHNDTAEARGKPSGLLLRLEAGDLGSVATTDAVTTGINRTPSPNAETGGLRTPEAGQYYDFRPLDVERSLSVARMDMRGTAAQMPRIATNRVDQAGVNAIEAWVNHMTRERGYPAPAP